MKRRQFLIYSSAAVLAGCAEEQEKPEAMIAFGIDASRSFIDKTEITFNHLNATKEKFTRTAGSKSRIVVTQISGHADAILFDGSPLTFSRQFPTAVSFKTWLAPKTNPDASRVYLSFAETVEWLCKVHEESPGMKSTVVVYSDMDDTHGGKDRLLTALKRYSKHSVSVWLYWVNNKDEWEAILKESGIVPHVEPKFRADPPVPIF